MFGLPPLLLRFTSIIVELCLHYCCVMPPLLLSYISIIVQVYLRYFSGLPLLLFRYTSFIVQVYLRYYSRIHPLLFRYASVIVQLYLRYCVWDGIRLMSGYSSNSKSCHLPTTSTDYANDLNKFFNRFDEHDFSKELHGLQTLLSDVDCNIVVSESEVRRHFINLNPSKGAGPDNVSSKVLKHCNRVVSGFHSHLQLIIQNWTGTSSVESIENYTSV